MRACSFAVFYTVVALGQMRKSSEYREASRAVSQYIDWLGFFIRGREIMDTIYDKPEVTSEEIQ